MRPRIKVLSERLGDPTTPKFTNACMLLNNIVYYGDLLSGNIFTRHLNLPFFSYCINMLLFVLYVIGGQHHWIYFLNREH